LYVERPSIRPGCRSLQVKEAFFQLVGRQPKKVHSLTPARLSLKASCVIGAMVVEMISIDVPLFEKNGSRTKFALYVVLQPAQLLERVFQFSY